MHKLSICGTVSVFFGEGIINVKSETVDKSIKFDNDHKSITLTDRIENTKKEVSPYYFNQVLELISGDFEEETLMELINNLPTVKPVL